MSNNYRNLQSKPTHGLCSDASYLKSKNLLEFQVVDIASGQQLIHKLYQGMVTPYLTNVGEFFGLVEAMKYRNTLNNPTLPIYSDSMVALNWAWREYTHSHLSPDDGVLFQEMIEGLNFIKKFPFGTKHLYKWHTKGWGEVPADFGRKSVKKKK